MQIMDAAGVSQIPVGLQKRLHVQEGSSAGAAIDSPNGQRPSWAQMQVGGRANANSASQRCILDMYLQSSSACN